MPRGFAPRHPPAAAALASRTASRTPQDHPGQRRSGPVSPHSSAFLRSSGRSEASRRSGPDARGGEGPRSADPSAAPPPGAASLRPPPGGRHSARHYCARTPQTRPRVPAVRPVSAPSPAFLRSLGGPEGPSGRAASTDASDSSTPATHPVVPTRPPPIRPNSSDPARIPPVRALGAARARGFEELRTGGTPNHLMPHGIRPTPPRTPPRRARTPQIRRGYRRFGPSEPREPAFLRS